MNWPVYDEYKDSGVTWIGAIPREWSVSRLGFEAWVRARLGWRGLKADEYIDDGVAFLSTPNIRSSQIDFINVNRITEVRYNESPEIMLSIGDVLLAKDGSTLGLVNIVKNLPEPTTVNGSIAVITSGDNIFEHYLYWMISSSLIQGRIQMLKGGMGVPHLFQDDIRRFELAIPPISQQIEIASFLDRETGNIDALIDKQHQLIATLREDRTATITHAVTKGLNPDAEMKDTDLGPIPAHWSEGARLKRVATVQTGLTLGKTPSETESVSLPYLRVANVQAGGVDLSEVKNVEIDRSEISKYLLRAGDVLMTEGGDIDKLGRGCLWDGQIAPCVHQNHVFAVRCSHELENRYLVYLLDTSIARDYFYLTAKKTTNLASTNSTTLGRFSFPLPPSVEQVQIIDFLNAECSRIDALIDSSTKSITTLREYRAALITAAVTGKIDVREAV